MWRDREKSARTEILIAKVKIIVGKTKSPDVFTKRGFLCRIDVLTNIPITYTIGIGAYLTVIAESQMKTNQQTALTNFKKAKSHIEKIIQMIESDQYCIDVMQQNLAVIGLLKSAHHLLMEGHLNTCFKSAMETNNDKRKQAMIEEILKVSKLANK